MPQASRPFSSAQSERAILRLRLPSRRLPTTVATLRMELIDSSSSMDEPLSRWRAAPEGAARLPHIWSASNFFHSSRVRHSFSRFSRDALYSNVLQILRSPLSLSVAAAVGLPASAVAAALAASTGVRSAEAGAAAMRAAAAADAKAILIISGPPGVEIPDGICTPPA